MAANKTIGGINVTIAATIDKFVNPLNKARASASRFSGTLDKMGLSLKAIGAGLTLGAFVHQVRSAADAIEDLNHRSQKLGVSTERLAGWGLAANEAEISTSELDRAMVRMAKNTGQSADHAMLQIADRIAAAKTEQEQLNIAIDAFGPRGAKMVVLLKQGSRALLESEETARKLGISVGKDAAAGVDRAGDAINRLKLRTTSAFTQMVAAGAPVIEFFSVTMVNAISATINSFKQWGDSFSQLGQMLGKFGNMGFAVMPEMRRPGAAPRASTGTSSARGLGGEGGAFSTGRGWGSDSYGGFAKFGADGKVDTNATIRAQIMQGMQMANPGRNNQAEMPAILKGLRSVLMGMDKYRKENRAEMAGLSVWRFLQEQFGPKAKVKGAGAGFGAGVRGLSADDPLSREGHSQRVRSLAQNDLQKTARMQLAEQKAMRKGIDKLAAGGGVQLMPLNLNGG